MIRPRFLAALGAMLVASAGCHHEKTTGVAEAQCPLLSSGAAASASSSTQTIAIVGCGVVTARFTGEIAVRGDVAYTTTWGGYLRTAGVPGNQINIWDVSGGAPVLVDSLIVSSALTLGDVTVTDDGKYLVVATEYTGGSILIYDLSNPRRPTFLSRFNDVNTDPGVHTAEIGRVDGHLYGFLAIDPGQGSAAKIVIVDLANPAAPRSIFVKTAGSPFLHDTFLRDGLLFVALWNAGLEIWDVGGGDAHGTPQNPVVLGRVSTVGGAAHNVWWFHDPVTGSRGYAFVGEEGAGSIGLSAQGDVHVVDVSDLHHPREVGFFTVPGAGAHNFSVDEPRGILYAAFYNGGVRALDIRGDLGTCSSAQQATVNGLTRCNLGAMGREVAHALVTGTPQTYIWGVEYENGFVYASDMINGIWKLKAVVR
jgi:hypothetical protein